MHEVIAYLAQRDFLPYDFCGGWRRETDGALAQADIIFVRRDSALRAHRQFWECETRTPDTNNITGESNLSCHMTKSKTEVPADVLAGWRGEHRRAATQSFGRDGHIQRRALSSRSWIAWRTDTSSGRACGL